MRNRSAAIARNSESSAPARQRAIEIDHRADVARDGRRQAVRDDVEMALHEDIGDRGLQQHHRHDDDQQRARIKALGQQLGERRARRSARPRGARQRGAARATEPSRSSVDDQPDSLSRAPSADRRDWRGRARSCAAGD